MAADDELDFHYDRILTAGEHNWMLVTQDMHERFFMAGLEEVDVQEIHEFREGNEDDDSDDEEDNEILDIPITVIDMDTIGAYMMYYTHSKVEGTHHYAQFLTAGWSRFYQERALNPGDMLRFKWRYYPRIIHVYVFRPQLDYELQVSYLPLVFDFPLYYKKEIDDFAGEDFYQCATLTVARYQWDDLIHAIFDYQRVKTVWENSEFAAVLRSAPNECFKDRLLWAMEGMDGKKFQSFCAIVSACWTIHNKVLHEEEVADWYGMVLGFINLVNDNMAFIKKTNGGVMKAAVVDSNRRWVCPPVGWCKINWDAAIRENQTGLGAVIRDDAGALVVVASLKVDTALQPLIAEARAALLGAMLGQKLMLKKVNSFSPEALIIEDIKDLASSFEDFSTAHVKRGGNAVAHYLAKWVFEIGDDVELMGGFPHCIVSLAHDDIMKF